MLGVALKGRREEAVIASKFGMHVGEDTTQYSGEMVAEAIDASLAALQTDYIDVMQIHCAAQPAPLHSYLCLRLRPTAPRAWQHRVRGRQYFCVARRPRCRGRAGNCGRRGQDQTL